MEYREVTLYFSMIYTLLLFYRSVKQMGDEFCIHVNEIQIFNLVTSFNTESNKY